LFAEPKDQQSQGNTNEHELVEKSNSSSRVDINAPLNAEFNLHLKSRGLQFEEQVNTPIKTNETNVNSKKTPLDITPLTHHPEHRVILNDDHSFQGNAKKLTDNLNDDSFSVRINTIDTIKPMMMPDLTPISQPSDPQTTTQSPNEQKPKVPMYAKKRLYPIKIEANNKDILDLEKKDKNTTNSPGRRILPLKSQVIESQNYGVLSGAQDPKVGLKKYIPTSTITRIAYRDQSQ